MKKFISPSAWFSMSYPDAWNEFEDGEGSFLFYNPEIWSGNFRISAYKGEQGYGEAAVRQELGGQSPALKVRIGSLECAYRKEMFEEEGTFYVSHHWVTGIGRIAFECSFTVSKGGGTAEAEAVIATLEVREEGKKYPAEVIPFRLSEAYEVNEAYEWTSATVKKKLTTDFQGVIGDLEKIQALIDEGHIEPRKKDEWLALGITACAILANEIEGAEWKTLVDGNREVPVLQYGERLIDPMKLTWSKVKAGEPVRISADEIL